MNNFVFRLGAVVYGLVIAMFGTNHLIAGQKLNVAVPKYFPSPVVWVYISGVCMILAALAIIINYQSKLAAYLLALLLAIFIFTIQMPQVLHAADEASRTMPTFNLLKDVGLLAGALMIASRGK